MTSGTANKFMAIKIPIRQHPDFCECETCNARYKQVEESQKADCTTIIFDIETIPQDEERLLTLAPNFEPDSRLKDPAKIEENIKKQKERYIERAALDWKTAQVVLIGVGDGEKFSPITGKESEVISSFLDIAKSAIDNSVSIGGHNVKGFDLPMLVNRARALKVPLPEGLLNFWRGRSQWSEFVFDTLEIFSFGDRQRIEGNGVEDICRAIGIKGKTADGAQFPSMWKNNQKSAIAYNQNDVMIEIEIAKLCGYKFNEAKK